jgi:hypothetical protein
MHNNKLVLSVVAILFSAIFSFGQNNTNSPYTRFGFGEISDNNSGEQRAMGGVSLGLRSPSTINTVNPASYSVVDSLSFMFDIGLSARMALFSDPSGRKTSFTGNLEYVTMQFPVNKWLGMSAGLLPYSFSGYDFHNTATIHGDKNNPKDTINVTTTYFGQGGISQVYGGISLKLFNHFSLGMNAYYMFGNSANMRQVVFLDGSTPSIQENRINVSDLRFRYGVQFFKTFNDKHAVSAGAIFEPKTSLNAEAIVTTMGVVSDTVTLGKNMFDLPMHFGVGVFYTYNNRLSFGLDYTLQSWKNAKFFGATDSLTNFSKIALGVEYVPNSLGRRFYERLHYRAGVNISNPYYNVNGIDMPKNIGASFGIGIPLPQSKTMLNATIEYGKVGNNKLMNENFLKLTFNATINEFWFFKRKL